MTIYASKGSSRDSRLHGCTESEPLHSFRAQGATRTGHEHVATIIETP